MNKRYDELMKNIDILSNVELKELVDILQSEKIELISELMLLNERIDKAIDILDNSSHYLEVCVEYCLTPMQLAHKTLRGEKYE